MKKLCALLIALTLLCSTFVSAAFAEDDLEYVHTVYTMTDLFDIFHEAAYDMKKEFTIHFDPSARHLLETMWHDSDLRQELSLCGGIYHYTWTPNIDELTAKIYVKCYYPGVRIAWAWANGDTSHLNDNEIRTMNIAQQIVDRSWSSDNIYQALYDALCTWGITYDSSDDGRRTELQTDVDAYSIRGFLLEHDTAIGALLNKRADCDGFADAYYLLVSMTGGNARHMAVRNCHHEICLAQMDDGYWYAFDACWDNGGSHNYYAMTEAKAIQTYGDTWKRELYREIFR